MEVAFGIHVRFSKFFILLTLILLIDMQGLIVIWELQVGPWSEPAMELLYRSF